MTTDRKIRQDRLKHTHLQFLKAEEQYPTLYSVAIRPRNEKHWPICSLDWMETNPLLVHQGFCSKSYEEYDEFMDKIGNAHNHWWIVSISLSRFRTRYCSILTSLPPHEKNDPRPLKKPFLPGVFPVTTKNKKWAARYIDPHFNGENEWEILPAVELFERMGEEMFADICIMEKVSGYEIGSYSQTRGWLEYLYDLFAAEPEVVGNAEITGLPWNIFSTSARAIEYLLESPQKEKKSGNCRYRPPLCKACGGKTKVLSKQGKTRYLECRKCGRKSSISE
jgi:hypothetical protein